MSESPAELATRLRAERSAVVASIASGALDIGSLGSDARAAPVKVVVLAQAVPGVGKVRSRRVLDALGIVDGARWGDLPPHVAARVVAALHEAAAAPGDGATGPAPRGPGA